MTAQVMCFMLSVVMVRLVLTTHTHFQAWLMHLPALAVLAILEMITGSCFADSRSTEGAHVRVVQHQRDGQVKK